MELAGSDEAQSGRSALWEDVHLLAESLPEISPGDIDLRGEFLGCTLSAPLLIAGMTGGHEGAHRINRNLAIAAAELGVAIGTGSQRAALRDPSLRATYSIIRETAPGAVVIGNLGMCQLVPQGDQPPFGPAEIEQAVEMIGADMLAVHMNAVEELIQPEGDRNLQGITEAIARVVEWSPVPVIAKETGAGISRATALRLAGAGVAAIDVGGVGGTSFARIEAARAAAMGDERGIRVGRTFRDWGIPTALAVIEARAAGLPLIATGGIRNGLHVAKALALGASIAGIGSPAIQAAAHGAGAVVEELSLMLEELRVAMTLVGAADLGALRGDRLVVLGRVAEWINARELG